MALSLTHDQITAALGALCPGKQYTVRGAMIEWNDVSPQPTDAAVTAAFNALPAPPNVTGFVLAVKAAFPDSVRRNTVMRAYPEMLPAIQMVDWTTVTALIQDSLSTTPTGIAITSAEHAALQAAWTANALPGTCP